MSANSNKAKAEDNRARILAALTKIAKAGGPTPSYAALSAKVGMAMTTVFGHVKALSDTGEIQVIDRPPMRQFVITATGYKTDMCVTGKPAGISGPDTTMDRFSQVLAGLGRFEDDHRAKQREIGRIHMRPPTQVAARDAA